MSLKTATVAPRSSATRRILGIAAVAVLCSFGTARSADRYVSPRGTDTANDCSTSTAPCRTIPHAVGQSAPGDVVKVAEGKYPETIEVGFSLTLAGGWRSDFAAQDAQKPTVGGIRLMPTGVAATIAVDNFSIPPHFPFELSADSGSVDVVVSRLDARHASPSSVEIAGTAVANVALTDATLRGPGIETRGTASLVLDLVDVHIVGGFEMLLRTTDMASVSASLADSVVEGTSGYYGIELVAFGQSQLAFEMLRSTVQRTRGTGVIAYDFDDSAIDLTIADSVITRTSRALEVSAGSLTSTVTATLENSLIWKNNKVFRTPSVFRDGGGIVAGGTGASLVLTNVTITRNRASKGAGINIDGGTLDLKNVILWGNLKRGATPDAGIDLHMEEGSPGLVVNADHSDIGDRVTLSGTYNDLGGNISANPLFAVPGSGYNLSASSPAVDTGTCAGAPPSDIEGDPRPTGAGCDIGVDELAP